MLHAYSNELLTQTEAVIIRAYIPSLSEWKAFTSAYSEISCCCQKISYAI